MAIKLVKWYFNIKNWNPTSNEWNKLMSCVSNEEKHGINKFVYRDDSKAALIGRALILKYLTLTLNVKSSNLKLDRTNKGRPVLCDEYLAQLNPPRILDFNISHSGDFCILCGICSEDQVSFDCTVGADVTKIIDKRSKELDRFLDMMSRREFLPQEWSIVKNAVTDRVKCINFTRLWCLKESFIKSNGLGLTFGLARIEFDCSPAFDEGLKVGTIFNETKVKLDGQYVNNWLFLESPIDNEHLAAIGLEKLDNHHNRSTIESIFDSESLIQPFQKIVIEDLVDTLTPLESDTKDEWIKFNTKLEKHCCH